MELYYFILGVLIMLSVTNLVQSRIFNYRQEKEQKEKIEKLFKEIKGTMEKFLEPTRQQYMEELEDFRKLALKVARTIQNKTKEK